MAAPQDRIACRQCDAVFYGNDDEPCKVCGSHDTVVLDSEEALYSLFAEAADYPYTPDHD